MAPAARARIRAAADHRSADERAGDQRRISMSAQAATATSRTLAIRVPGAHRHERRAAAGRRPHANDGAHRAALAERIREQEALILKLTGLVKRIALELREHLPPHVEVDDLVSAGTIGLIDAVRRFEAGKQVKIETFARFRIRGAMLDALRGQDPASRDMRKKNKQAEQVFQKLAVNLGRTPTDAEMAEALHMTLENWYEKVNQLQSMGVEWLRPMQVNESYLGGEENLPDKNHEDQFDLCYRREQRDLLDRALEQVSERERRILSLYYEQDFTMKQIADQLGVDESRVSQILARLLSRLKNTVHSMLRAPAMGTPFQQAA
jgi:RNA polymerase sigma factor for flagellar operon FliA